MIAELGLSLLLHKATPAPQFPTVTEIAAQCDADAGCHQFKEDRRIQALIDSEQTSIGNNYSPGYCTSWVASQRAIGQSYGNANQWLDAARADGYETGSKPYKGAIAWTNEGYWGHVAAVIGVGDGVVTVSEMNYPTWNVVTTRTVPASSFTYIY